MDGAASGAICRGQLCGASRDGHVTGRGIYYASCVRPAAIQASEACCRVVHMTLRVRSPLGRSSGDIPRPNLRPPALGPGSIHAGAAHSVFLKAGLSVHTHVQKHDSREVQTNCAGSRFWQWRGLWRLGCEVVTAAAAHTQQCLQPWQAAGVGQGSC